MLRFVYQLVILTRFSSLFPLALERYSLMAVTELTVMN